MADRARQRADGRWQIRIELGVQPGKDGVPRRRRHFVYGQTKREVERKAREAERAIEEGRSVASDRQTVAQFLESWLETKRYKRPKTFRHYDQMVHGHLIPLLGHLRLVQLHPRDVQQALDARAAVGAAPRTVHHLRAVLRNALNQAVEWRILAHNPALAVALPVARPARCLGSAPNRWAKTKRSLGEGSIGPTGGQGRPGAGHPRGGSWPFSAGPGVKMGVKSPGRGEILPRPQRADGQIRTDDLLFTKQPLYP